MKYIKALWKKIKLRFSIINTLFLFLWKNKMWWVMPMIFVLVVFFLIMIFAQSSPLGPLIYTLF